MNLDKLMAWVVAVVLLYATTGNLDQLQKWIWKAQAKAIYDSRSSTWGSPRFFSHESSHVKVKSK
jgi:hypothetical protein